MPTGQLTQVGLDLLRDALLGVVSDASIKYCAVGTGAGATLSAALVASTQYTALAVTALAVGLAVGQNVTLIDTNGNTQQVTVAAGGAAVGATSVPITAFSAAYAFSTSTALVNTPAATDTALQAEAFRFPVTDQANGSNFGEGLTTTYISPGQASISIQEIGWFAGAGASSTPGSGVMIARAIYSHNHTSLESLQTVLDSAI